MGTTLAAIKEEAGVGVRLVRWLFGSVGRLVLAADRFAPSSVKQTYGEDGGVRRR